MKYLCPRDFRRGEMEENMVNSVITSIKIRWEDIASDSWLRQIPALHDLDHLSLPRRLTIFTGENGSGKSTLLEAMAIASGFNPEGGTRNYHFATRDSHSSLHEALTLVRRPPMLRGGYFLRAESFYQTATMEEAYADAQHPSKKYHERSHGESFLALADDHFGRPGLFFLDEPEAALSWQHQLTLAFMISESLALGSQFIIATHSPLLMSIPDACLLHFGPDGISPCTVEETESWQIMTLLVSHRDQLFSHLLNKTEK